MYLASIIWVILSQTLSFFPCFVIYQFISKKQILSVTLVDLVYRDLVIYIYLMCFVASTSVIHCFSVGNDTLTLSYEFATVYSVTISFFVSSISISLIFSGVLRLISVIKKSEAAGLQLLGSDYIALNKIRLVSVTFSLIFPCLLIYFFNAHPALFSLYNGTQSTFFQDVENNWAIALYPVLPCIATVVNAIAKICSDFIKENIDRQVNVFTIYGSKQCISEGKVIFLSLEVTIGIPVLFLIYTPFSSFSDRTTRFTFFIPLQIIILGFIVPLIVIKRNIKIINFMKQNYIEPVFEHPLVMLLKKKTSTVVPLQEMYELHF
jgi:hypothetical protein